MYSDPDAATSRYLSYEQYSVPCADLTEELQYLTESLEGILALIYNDQCVGIQVPLTVELTSSVRPGHQRFVRHRPTKPATLETGLGRAGA